MYEGINSAIVQLAITCSAVLGACIAGGIFASRVALRRYQQKIEK